MARTKHKAAEQEQGGKKGNGRLIPRITGRPDASRWDPDHDGNGKRQAERPLNECFFEGLLTCY